MNPDILKAGIVDNKYFLLVFQLRASNRVISGYPGFY
jgi:hypothetical protein